MGSHHHSYDADRPGLRLIIEMRTTHRVNISITHPLSSISFYNLGSTCLSRTERYMTHTKGSYWGWDATSNRRAEGSMRSWFSRLQSSAPSCEADGQLKLPTPEIARYSNQGIDRIILFVIFFTFHFSLFSFCIFHLFKFYVRSDCIWLGCAKSKIVKRCLNIIKIIRNYYYYYINNNII